MASPPPRRPWRRHSRTPLLAAAVWAGLIAATSSTVVLPHDFFAWIAAHVLPDESAYRAFVAFWGVAWFTVVKGWHAAEFAILFTLTLAALRRVCGPCRGWDILIAAGLCLLFAASDEYHQTFVPGRGGTVTDVTIDALGVALAAAVAEARRNRRTRRSVSADGAAKAGPPAP